MIPTEKKAILISDLDRQTALDFIHWLKSNHPDLLNKIRNNPQTMQETSAKSLNLAKLVPAISVNPDSLRRISYF